MCTFPTHKSGFVVLHQNQTDILCQQAARQQIQQGLVYPVILNKCFGFTPCGAVVFSEIKLHFPVQFFLKNYFIRLIKEKALVLNQEHTESTFTLFSMYDSFAPLFKLFFETF